MDKKPHDALFKVAFSSLPSAGDLLRSIVDEEVASQLDWDSLRHAPTELTDAALTSNTADLLFTIHTIGGEPTLLYLIFEHQSTSHPLMPVRLFLYTARIWEAWLRDNAGAQRVPPVLSVVLHHASTPSQNWSAPVSLTETYAAQASFVQAASPYLPRLRLQLFDLTVEPDDALLNRAVPAVVRLVLLVLKHARHSRDINTRMMRWVALAAEVGSTASGENMLKTIVRYLSNVSKHASHEGMSNMLRSALGSRGEKIAMGFGQQLREEGRQEARAEAARKYQQLLLLWLQQRFGDLPDSVSERVRNASDEQLDTWLRRVVIADSIEAVFASDES